MGFNSGFKGLKTILKFTLKQLRHVSVQSHHHQERITHVC